MTRDAVTVMWKEWKEILSAGGSRGRLGVLLFAGVFGIVLPLQMGRAWVESPMMLAYWGWVPLFLVISVVADSFAGERERHTLETLLASRLSDRAVLFGKIASAVGYGVGITWTSLLLGLITANIAHGHGELLIYSPVVGFGILTLSLLGAGLAATAGVLVSLRASTVRQAQQTLNISVMVGFFVLVLGVRALPREWEAALFGTVTAMGLSSVIGLVVLVLVIIDAVLLAAAMAKFRRTQLIVD
jgi:ABC-2 type transport system permease protein